MMKLNRDNYYSLEADKEYLSVSQWKSFYECEAAGLAQVRGVYKPEKTTALLIGSYVDAAVEGTLPEFMEAHPEIMTQKGTLRADFIHANKMVERLSRDKLFVEYLQGDKQVIMTGTIGTVNVKIKVDVLADNRIVDLKTTRDFKPVWVPGGKIPWFAAWNYELQGAVYREIVRQNTGKTLPFYLAAVTKEDIPDIDIVEIDGETMDRELVRFSSYAERIDSIKMGLIVPIRCEECQYCKETKVLTGVTPSQKLYEEAGVA